MHLAFSGGANRKNGGAARGLDRATSRVQLLEITWRGDFFVWIESLSGSDASSHFFCACSILRGEVNELMLR